MKVSQKIVIPLVSALAGCCGIGIGLLIRQPEINALQKQVAQMQGQYDELVTIIQTQNNEIISLVSQYRSLKLWQVFKKRNKQREARSALVFQYAIYDYFTLLFERLDTGRAFLEDESSFYNTLSLMLDGRDPNSEQMDFIERFVLERHKNQIEELTICDTSKLLERIRDYQAPVKSDRIRLPRVAFPKPKIPKVSLLLPWNKDTREA